ncbi:MAG: glycerate kinase [Isosphaeraceae bacterium]
MRVVIAPDKFRGSLSAMEAAAAMARGVSLAEPSAIVEEIPMADGGEGTIDALVTSTRGSYQEVQVTGPLGAPVLARYGLLGDGRTAVIEMATASGLALVPKSARDPSRTTTRGTGELVLHALDSGARHFIVGIGGSATNDGGAGFAQAVGYRLLDRNGDDLDPGGGSLDALDRIDPSGVDPRLAETTMRVACDVDNPLCGPRGASAVYGPQKGADPAMIERLDRNLGRLADRIERDLGRDVRDLPGAGAAGGLGAGLVAFASGTLEPGVDLVIQTVDLADRLRSADLCLTGEGSIDASSAFGKTAVGVARLASGLGLPTIAIGGTLGPGAEDVIAEGVNALFSICPGPSTLDEAIAHAPEWLERASRQAVAAFLAGRASAGRSDRSEHE